MDSGENEIRTAMAPCWSTEDASVIFRTEALEGVDAVFLATHTPIRGFEVSGSKAASIDKPDEQSLLTALSNNSQRHAFCVVHGEAGAGKSHLIRWLYVNWRNERDLKLLLQRSDGSLEGAIRQLERRLPEEYQEMFQGLGERTTLNPDGQSLIFTVTLAALLRPDLREGEALEDEGWCKQFQPWELLEFSDIKETWSAPGKIIEILTGLGDASESASFNLSHLCELFSLLDAKNFEIKNHELGFELFDEVEEKILPRIREGKDEEEIIQEIGHEIPFSINFLKALNRRRNDVVQKLIGITSAGFKKVFTDVRRALAAEGRRLVLCLEDITSWEGLDESLIDALVTNSETREEDDLCDLISVVGVTPKYFRDLPGNYRDRITHEIQLGEESEGLQDVVTLRNQENRLNFVAPYLAATRAGTGRLEAWREKQIDDPDLPRPNQCEACDVRNRCFTAFGQVEGVGLFPFTERSIEGFYNTLLTDDSGRTLQTPRGIIQNILAPTLEHAEAIKQEAYPGAFIEVKAFKQRDLQISSYAETLIFSVAPDDDEIQNRLKRLIAFWGADGEESTAKDDDGCLTFNGIRKDVYEAFGLPWLGGEEATNINTDLTPETEPETEPEPETDLTPDPAPRPKPDPTPRPMPDPTPRPMPDPTPRPKPTAKRPRNLNPEDIRKWAGGGRLDNSDKWNKALYYLLSQVENIRLLGADPWTWRKYLTQNLVMFEGTGAVDPGVHFVVPRESWVRSGMEAYAYLSESLDQPDAVIEFHRFELAKMMRRLSLLVKDHLAQRLAANVNDGSWNPVTSIAQVLLARDWLRGRTRPNDSSGDQWRALLSDEEEIRTSPKIRTESWGRFLEETSHQHDDLRTTLREMTSLPQGTSNDRGLTDASVALELIQLMEGLKFAAVPNEIKRQGQSTNILEKAVERQKTSAKTLHRTIREEFSRLLRQAQRSNAALRENSVKEHIQRIDKILDETMKVIPNAAPSKINDWKTLSTDLVEQLENDRDLQNKLHADLDKIEELEPDDGNSLRTLFSEEISIGAGDLEKLFRCLNSGEEAINAVLESQVRPLLTEADQSGGDISQVHGAGQKLRAATDKALNALPGPEINL